MTQDYAPDVYAKTKYTLIEISAVMAERQRQRVATVHPDQCMVINQDILTFADSHAPVNTDCFFLAMEVLDNLPHDKVHLENGKWRETVIQLKENGQEAAKSDAPSEYPELVEVTRPVQDQLIHQTLQRFGCDLPLKTSYKFNSGLARAVRTAIGKDHVELHSAFIPTGAMQLLNTLRQSFPKHHIIAADFDTLPPPKLDATSNVKAIDHPLSPTATSAGPLCAGNAPLVASKLTGRCRPDCQRPRGKFVSDSCLMVFFCVLVQALRKTTTRIWSKEELPTFSSPPTLRG